MKQLNHLIIFSDLDGCLLNKHDYQWHDAEKCLDRLVDLGIPVVFSSSKTVCEIEAIASHVPCMPAPYIAENGGAICWGSLREDGDLPVQCTGIARSEILEILAELKSQFQFRSFRDLGLDGVMASTDLSASDAALAMKRQSTEPLLWDDSVERRAEFEHLLRQHAFTMTKGGRFWHVAGQTSKGKALQQVVRKFGDEQAIVVAIGDSQIDQSMLDVADIPVGIRAGGNLNVNVTCPPGIIPESEGAKGWAEAVTEILDRFV